MGVSFAILLGANVLALILWCVVLARVARTAARLVRVRDGVDAPEPPGGWPPAFVIVPAHNEERVIGACVAAMRAQDHPRLTAIFVLDRCTDESAAIARRRAEDDPRVVIFHNDHCPPDWAGKCHAAWLGATLARTLPGGADPRSTLVFTDADTAFDPRLVRAATACANRRRSGLLSLLPRLTIGHRFERLLQPVASMTLMRMYPIERVEHPRRPRAFANGQFMLFSRATYDAIGGHAAVRDDLLEDLAFARRVVEHGGRVSVLAADELLSVSMYETREAFERGWTRIFIEACHRKPGRMRKNAMRTLATGVAIPIVQFALAAWCVWAMTNATMSGAGGPWPWIGIAVIGAALAMQVVALCWIYAMVGAPRRGILAFPLGSMVVAKCLFAGARDLEQGRPIRWGGREYVLKAR